MFWAQGTAEPLRCLRGKARRLTYLEAGGRGGERCGDEIRWRRAWVQCDYQSVVRTLAVTLSERRRHERVRSTSVTGCALTF